MTDKTNKILTISIMAVGALAAWFSYVENRKDREAKAEIVKLDKGIKELQLLKLQQAA